jgi:hypothetical protein
MKFRMKLSKEKDQKVITDRWLYFSEQTNYWDNILVQKELR